MPRDILIVGASIAGCTTAVLLARAGHRVVVIDRIRSVNSFKRVCTHLIQNSAVPTLERLGILDSMIRSGAKVSALKIWFRTRWTRMCPEYSRDARGHTWNLNLRREVLDPMVRQLAISTPGIEMSLGASLDSLIEENGRVVGAVVTQNNRKITFATSLVIGADGRHSKTAELARIPVHEFQNIRGGWGAYYRNVKQGNGTDTHFWLLEPDIAYCFPTDNDLTLLATITTQENLAVWKKDIEHHHLQCLQALPDGPDLSCAERVSDFFGMLKAPGYYRNPGYQPGVVLVGDAALTTDFVWGDGCSCAFRSAEMLADAIGPASVKLNDRKLDASIKSYRIQHARTFYYPAAGNAGFSKRTKLELIRGLIFQAAQSNARVQHLLFELQSGRVNSCTGGIRLLVHTLLFHLNRRCGRRRPENSKSTVNEPTRQVL